MKWSAFVSFALLGLARADNAYEDVKCNQLQTQNALDLEELVGKWYVVEVIDHKKPAAQVTGTASPNSIVVADACPIVTLLGQHRNGHSTHYAKIRMLWQENIGNVEYTFAVDKNSLGLWKTSTPQNGSMTEEPKYTQFYGNVHILKAIGTHLVLTFCPKSNEGQFYTLLLARDFNVPPVDRQGVHKLLQRRELSNYVIKKTCNNNANASAVSLMLVLLLSLTLLAKNFK